MYSIWYVPIMGSRSRVYENGCAKSENPIKAFSLVNMLSAEAQPYAFQFDPAKTALVLSESVYL